MSEVENRNDRGNKHKNGDKERERKGGRNKRGIRDKKRGREREKVKMRGKKIGGWGGKEKGGKIVGVSDENSQKDMRRMRERYGERKEVKLLLTASSVAQTECKTTERSLVTS